MTTIERHPWSLRDWTTRIIQPSDVPGGRGLIDRVVLTTVGLLHDRSVPVTAEAVASQCGLDVDLVASSVETALRQDLLDDDLRPVMPELSADELRSRARLAEMAEIVAATRCTLCSAPKGTHCTTATGKPTTPHQAREQLARKHSASEAA